MGSGDGADVVQAVAIEINTHHPIHRDTRRYWECAFKIFAPLVICYRMLLCGRMTHNNQCRVVPNGPRRIVCLTEEPTELLYALGEGDRIVGISAYTLRPPEARESKPVVSAFIGGSVPKIAALKPDLIIGFSDIQADLAKKLISANLPVLIFNQRTIQEIFEMIVTVGGIVGRRQEAQDLVSSYLSNIERVQARASKRALRPTVYFEEWGEPMICGIEWVSELIDIAGGRDVFAEKARGRGAKDRFVSVEELVSAAPDVYLASWCGKAFDRDLVDGRPGAQDIPALRSGRVHEIQPEIILQPGPACLTDGLAELERCIHAPSPHA